MNDKIKTLAEEAGFMLWQNEPWNPGDVIDWSARYDKELKAFAELIVRECIDNVEVWEKDSRNHISYMLKQHFGVEL